MPIGVVTSFDEEKGWGSIRSDDGEEHFFHCTSIADGTRTIETGTEVRFEVRAGNLGRWEAAGIQPATG